MDRSVFSGSFYGYLPRLPGILPRKGPSAAQPRISGPKSHLLLWIMPAFPRFQQDQTLRFCNRGFPDGADPRSQLCLLFYSQRDCLPQEARCSEGHVIHPVRTILRIPGYPLRESIVLFPRNCSQALHSDPQTAGLFPSHHPAHSNKLHLWRSHSVWNHLSSDQTSIPPRWTFLPETVSDHNPYLRACSDHILSHRGPARQKAPWRSAETPALSADLHSQSSHRHNIRLPVHDPQRRCLFRKTVLSYRDRRPLL